MCIACAFGRSYLRILQEVDRATTDLTQGYADLFADSQVKKPKKAKKGKKLKRTLKHPDGTSDCAQNLVLPPSLPGSCVSFPAPEVVPTLRVGGWSIGMP